MTNDFTSEEIYPYIVVYNNIYEDNDRMYEIAKKTFSNTNDPRFLDVPSQWSLFGDYIRDVEFHFDKGSTELKIHHEPNLDAEFEKDQYYFTSQIVKGFYRVMSDYATRYNIPINDEGLENIIVDGYGSLPIPQWRITGPSICKYNENAGNADSKAMRYHSDYIREPMNSPGFKFIITSTSYINDDYEGGELDFVVNNKLIGYKPKAGDIIVFPSGSPDYLTEDGQVYLHGVQKVSSGEKYFTRMYWTKYYPSDSEWENKVNEFGLDGWKEEYSKLVNEYNNSNPQREFIDRAVRIK
jgi:hypothetical protein